MPDQQFKREERLRSSKEIQRLFKQGNSFAQYPLRLVWLPMEERRSTFPAQFAVSVPKKKFKSAVLRNRLRRQLREAYRLQKHELYQILTPHYPQIAFMVLYTASEQLPYKQIEGAMQGLIRRFGKAIKKAAKSPTNEPGSA